MKRKQSFSKLSRWRKPLSIMLLSVSIAIASGHYSNQLMSAQAKAAKAEKPKPKPPKPPKPPPKQKPGSKHQPVIPQEVLADLQVSPIESNNHLVRLQASGPLAFDRLQTKTPRQVLVRLYRAKLGSLPEIAPPPFGTVTLTEESGGSVLVDLNLFSASQRVSVAQGGNPNTIEIRIRD